MEKKAEIIQTCISVCSVTEEFDRSSKDLILRMSLKSYSKFLVGLFDVSISIQVLEL